MFHKFKDLRGYQLRATDGELGDVDDLYFDDYEWRVRYFVVNTGSWLLGRKVLISPESVTGIDRDERVLEVKLTRKQVEDSPDITTEAPISQQHEVSLSSHYGWPMYWANAYPMRPGMVYPIGVPYGYVGAQAVPVPLDPIGQERENTVDREIREIEEAHPNTRLRSARDVEGHHIAATDGEIGDVEDYIIDDENWFIRYLVVDTGGWLSGRKVLLIPEWIESIHWEERRVYVNLTRAEVQNSPEYDHNSPLTRDYETRLFETYKRPKYWEQINDLPSREEVREANIEAGRAKTRKKRS